eukprot:COSAG06_NODE_17515_length_936_cov_0.822196_1_plen_101_part_10
MVCQDRLETDPWKLDRNGIHLSQDNPLNERRPDLSLVEAGCPAPLLSMMERCWVDVPSERPSVEQFIEALRIYELEAAAEAEYRKVSSCRGEFVSLLLLHG